MSISSHGDDLTVDVIHRGNDGSENADDAAVAGTLRANEDRYIRRLRWKIDCFSGDTGLDHQIGFRSEMVDEWATMSFPGTVTSTNTGVLEFIHHEFHYIQDTASGTGLSDGVNRTLTWEYAPGEVEWAEGDELQLVEYVPTNQGSYRASIEVYWEEVN